MKDENIHILIDHHEYNKLFNSNSKQLIINVNLDSVAIPESLIDSFISNNEYMNFLKDALSKRENIDFILEQDELVLMKKTISPVTIVLGIKLKENELEDEFKRDFKVLLNKINILSYLNKNSKKTFTTSVDNKNIELPYNDIINVILDYTKYCEFINSKQKYFDLTKCEFVYVLKEFIEEKRIFIAFELDTSTITFYKSLIQLFDTYAINKNLETDFKYSSKVSINSHFETFIQNEIPKNISVLEKTIYIYMNLFQVLTYDLEFIDDDVIKKHKDMTRVEEINQKNNRVFSYEFSCLFGKFLEKLNLKFEYNDKYIIARINNFIVKYKAISPEFNLQKLTQLEIIKGVTLLNDNKNTKSEFNKLTSKIYNNLYQKKVDLEILKMPFNKLTIYYKKTSNKISIPFEKKYEIFLRLISNVALENNAIGYIYELRKIIFNEDDLNTHISFATIAEYNDKKVSPAVIITMNSININLYNSNKYVYYNPTNKIEKYTLKQLRRQFFNGRFKYIKNSRDNIKGVEKSNIC